MKPLFDSPTSVLDILTFGFKSAFRSLKDMSRFTAPLAILYGVNFGFLSWLVVNTTALPDSARGLAITLCYIGLLVLAGWSLYGTARYARDSFCGESHGTARYLLPQWNVLGTACIATLYGSSLIAWLIGGLLAGIFGLFLMILMMWGVGSAFPGPFGGFLALVIMLGCFTGYGLLMMACLTTLNALFGVYLAVYLEGGRNLASAFAESFSLTFSHFGRTVTLGFTAWLVNFILMLPLTLIEMILNVMTEQSPSTFESAVSLGGFVMLGGLHAWFSFTLGLGGFMFAMYRYYHDLKLRKANPAELIDLPASEAPETSRRHAS